jgi:hypothetical protein
MPQFQADPGKKVHETPSQWKKGMAGSINPSRIVVQAGSGQKQDPNSKLTRAKGARGHGSSGRALEFKPK